MRNRDQPEVCRTRFACSLASAPSGTSPTAEPNATVTVETEVEIPNAEFDYVRETTANVTGDWSIHVANPGTYSVSGGVNGTIEVTDEAVRSGSRLSG